MIVSIFLILIVFSAVLFLVWFWFYKGLGSFGKNLKKAIKKDFEKGNFKKVKELLLKDSDLENNLDNIYQLGSVHLKLNEYEDAIVRFNEVLKKNPKHFDALMGIAQSYQHQEKYAEAMEAYDKASKENVKDFNCPLNMGEILFETGDYSKALEVLEKAKELFPENVKILFTIAKCKSELCNIDNEEEYQAVFDELNKLADNEDLPEEFDITIAKLYAKTGQLDDAFYHCKHATEKNEENIEAYKLLGLIQLLKKDFSGAKNSLTVALNFQSNNDEIHRLFSYLLCSHEDGCAMQKCRQKYYDLIRKRYGKQNIN